MVRLFIALVVGVVLTVGAGTLQAAAKVPVARTVPAVGAASAAHHHHHHHHHRR